MENRLSKLKTIQAKKIETSSQIQRLFLNDSVKYPLVINSVNQTLDLYNWISGNRNQFDEDLLVYGAILLRGFKINTVEKFQRLMSIFPNDLLEYKLRSSPRYSLEKNVYVSTTYPEDQIIQMHSESSYAPIHPERIVFCCITPAELKGETPIADNRVILTHLSEATKNKFYEKGIMYRRNLNGLLGLNWQEVFQTADKAYVEEECNKTNMRFQWTGDDSLVLEWEKRAIWKHPVSNELVWFNHGLFFNKYMQDEEVLNSVGSYKDLPNDTFFGDGTEISRQEIEEIRIAYKKSTVEFPWEKGDVLFLDNMLFSHGRNPYKGARKIIVSIS